MRPWSQNLPLGLIMILRRFVNLALKILRTPQYVTLVLSLILFLVLWSNLFNDGKGKNLVEFLKHEKRTSHFRPVRRISLGEEEDKKNDRCPIYQFKPNNFLRVPDNDNISVACKRLLPMPGSCEDAKDIFDLDGPPNPATCSDQERFDICQLQRTDTNAWAVLCELNTTTAGCSSGFKLGLPSHETGNLTWEMYETSSLLEEKLTDLIQGSGSSNQPPHYGFAFIRCENEISVHLDYYVYQNEDDIEQLLILPPFIKSSKNIEHHHIPSSFHDLNLNMIFVDSVSHQHMFRSLPKTVSVLEQIATSSVADVLNFELFQAIKSRTFETLQTIFSGYVNVTEQAFGTYEVPPNPLNLAPIYKPLRSRGYRTLWLEDLCYLWEWGISKDLRFLQQDSSPKDTWRRMWSALEANAIDSIDATIAMCQVLKANGVRDHFHGPDAVCFNGRHQHEYLLEYLKLYQAEMVAQNQPFFTMTSTNVAHESTGKRVQTLDDALADYLSFTAHLENTVTIIFSDHGNSYGKYFTVSEEAMVELYHPFMFFIIPHSAGTLLGGEMMNNLKLNTKRLVTSLDIHYTLLHLADINAKGRSKAPNQEFHVSEKGLFDSVDPERDCFSVPRLKPNVCICQLSSVELESSSFASLFGYLAIGVLNEEIQYQHRQSLVDSSSPITAFGNCQPLHLEKVTDIKQLTGPDNQKFFQMNLHVQQSQIFFVYVTLKRKDDGTLKTILDSYVRTTQYGIYSDCCDPTVVTALCVCDLSSSAAENAEHESHHTHIIPQSAHHQNDRKNIPSITNQKLDKLSFLRSTTFTNNSVLPFFNRVVTPFKQALCFSIFTVLHKGGEALFGVNGCEGVYTLKMSVSGASKFVYFHNREDAIVLPGGVAFSGLIVSEYGELWKDFVQTEFTLKKTLKVNH